MAAVNTSPPSCGTSTSATASDKGPIYHNICTHPDFADRSPDELRFAAYTSGVSVSSSTTAIHPSPKRPLSRVKHASEAMRAIKTGICISAGVFAVHLHSSDILAWHQTLQKTKESRCAQLLELDDRIKQIRQGAADTADSVLVQTEAARANLLAANKTVPALFYLNAATNQWASDDAIVAFLTQVAQQTSPRISDWVEVRWQMINNQETYSAHLFSALSSLSAVTLPLRLSVSCRQAPPNIRQYSQPLWFVSELLTMGNHALDVLADWLETSVQPASPSQQWFDLPRICLFDMQAVEAIPFSFAKVRGSRVVALHRHSCVFVKTCLAIEIALAYHRRGGSATDNTKSSSDLSEDKSSVRANNNTRRAQRREKKHNKKVQHQTQLATLQIHDLGIKWYLRPCSSCRQLPDSGYSPCRNGISIKSSSSKLKPLSPLLSHAADAVMLQERGLLCDIQLGGFEYFRELSTLTQILQSKQNGDGNIWSTLDSREQTYVQDVYKYIGDLKKQVDGNETKAIWLHAAYVWMLEVQDMLHHPSTAHFHHVFRFVWDERLQLHSGTAFMHAILTALEEQFQCRDRPAGWQRKRLSKVRHMPLTRKVYGSNGSVGWFERFQRRPEDIPDYHRCDACRDSLASIRAQLFPWHAALDRGNRHPVAGIYEYNSVMCLRLAHMWASASHDCLLRMQQWLCAELEVIDAALRTNNPVAPSGETTLVLGDIYDTVPRVTLRMNRAAPKEQARHSVAEMARAFDGREMPFNLTYLHLVYHCILLLPEYVTTAGALSMAKIGDFMTFAVQDVLDRQSRRCETGDCFVCHSFKAYHPIAIAQLAPAPAASAAAELLDHQTDKVANDHGLQEAAAMVESVHQSEIQPAAAAAAAAATPDHQSIGVQRTCACHKGSSSAEIWASSARYRVCCVMGTESYLHKSCFRHLFQTENINGTCPDNNCVATQGVHDVKSVEAWDDEMRLRKVLLAATTVVSATIGRRSDNPDSGHEVEQPLTSVVPHAALSSADTVTTSLSCAPTVERVECREGEGGAEAETEKEEVQPIALRDMSALIPLRSNKVDGPEATMARLPFVPHRKPKKHMSLSEFHVCASAQADLEHLAKAAAIPSLSLVKRPAGSSVSPTFVRHTTSTSSSQPLKSQIPTIDKTNHKQQLEATSSSIAPATKAASSSSLLDWKTYVCAPAPMLGARTCYLLIHVSAGCIFPDELSATRELTGVRDELVEARRLMNIDSRADQVPFAWHECTGHVKYGAVIFLQFQNMQAQRRWELLPAAKFPLISQAPHRYVLPDASLLAIWSTLKLH